MNNRRNLQIKKNSISSNGRIFVEKGTNSSVSTRILPQKGPDPGKGGGPISNRGKGGGPLFDPGRTSLDTISIDLVGHLDGPIDVGKLKTGPVRFLTDLSSLEYYRSISKARFMVPAIGEKVLLLYVTFFLVIDIFF
jgi:hypothetical protein